MTRQRAGIFDPWRQEHKAEVAPQLTKVGGDTTEHVEPQPVRFAGRRGGIVVWLPGGDAAQAQTNILFALESLMGDRALFAIFHKWGIGGKEQVEGTAPRTVISDGTRMVVVLGEYERAMDAVALALREVVRAKNSVSEYLASLGIRPYIV